MRANRTWNFVVAMTASSIVAFNLNASDDAKINQFLRFAPEGLKKWEDREKIGTSFVKMTVRTVEQDRTTYERNSYFKIYRSGPLVRIDGSGEDRNVVSVILAGKDFGARMRRKPDGSGFETKWLGKPTELSDNLLKITQGLGGIMSPRSLFGIPVVEIMKHPDFRVDKIEIVPREGKELWKVHFDRVTKDSTVGSMYDSWVLLDPESDWAVIESRYHFAKDHSVAYSIRNEYVKGPDGVDRIKFARRSSSSSKTKSSGDSDFEIIEYDPTAPSDAKFEMSNLGLPDLQSPMIVQTTNTSRNWLFAGAFALFGIAFWLNRAARRGA